MKIVTKNFFSFFFLLFNICWVVCIWGDSWKWHDSFLFFRQNLEPSHPQSGDDDSQHHSHHLLFLVGLKISSLLKPRLILIIILAKPSFPRVPVLVQLLGHVPAFATPWAAAHQASLSVTSSQSLLKLMSIKLVMPCNHLILCHPLLLLPSIFPSIRVFSNESILCIRWPKYWSFSFSFSPSIKYSELISFRIYWLDTLAVQGTLKSLLQHHSSKASVF